MTESTINESTGEVREPRPLWKSISYTMIKVGSGASFYAILGLAYFFWEVEVGLSGNLVALAFVIFGVWDAINDPLIGYFTDKKYKFTEKYGRRLPWIILGLLPASFFALFVINEYRKFIIKLFNDATIFLDNYNSVSWCNSQVIYSQVIGFFFTT